MKKEHKIIDVDPLDVEPIKMKSRFECYSIVRHNGDFSL